MRQSGGGAGPGGSCKQIGKSGRSGRERRGRLLALKQFAGKNNNNVKVHILGNVCLASCQLSKKLVPGLFPFARLRLIWSR